MESITKPTLTNEQLASICREHLCDPLKSAEELTDGWFNAAYLLTSTAGREAVLKVAPPDSVRLMRYEHELMPAEVSALRLVKNMTAVPVPGVIAYDTSRQIVDGGFFLTERLSGIPLNHARPNLSPESQERIDRQVGSYLKEMHGITGPRFGTYTVPQYSTWTDAFSSLVDWLKQDASDVRIDLPHEALNSIERNQWALEEVLVPNLVHWDLWDGNVFVDPDEGIVTGLIDFERVLWADPLIEENFKAPKPGLLEAYGEPILESPGAKMRRQLYTLYLYSIMVVECRFRHFTPEHETWARGLLDDSLKEFRLLQAG